MRHSQWVGSVGRHRGVGQDVGHELVAADAGDLLGDVGLDREIAPPGRDAREDDLVLAGVDVEGHRTGGDGDACPGRGGLGRDPDPLQQGALLGRAGRRPEEPVDASRAERHVRRGRRLRRRVDDATRDRTAGPLGDEPGRPVRAEPGQSMLLALLEPEARLRAQGVPEGCPADAHRIEDRGLDDDVRRGVGDLGTSSAHDPGDADGAVRVGDEERVGRQLAIDVIERLEPLPLAGESDDDLAPADRGGVERVDGLAELEHDVVADVDDVADRALAGREEAHLDLVRRRPDADARDMPADEPRAQVRVLDGDGQALRDRVAGLLGVGLREAHGGAGDRRDLAGDADEAQDVAPIGLDVDVEDGVAVQVDEGQAERRIRGQDEDAVAVAGQAQFVARTEHAVGHHAHLLGPLDAPIAWQDGAGQGHGDALAGGDVRRATHDLQRLTAPDGHPGERQAVRARVAFHAQQLADDDVLPVRAPCLDVRDVHAQQGQALGQRLRRVLDVDVVAEPRQRDSHANCSRKRRSFSWNRRRSVMPCLSILIRSGPIPKAKPW